MGLFYNNQVPVTLIGTKSVTTLTPVTLQSTYQVESPTVATKTFETGLMPRVEFLINYTEGATETANSIQIKLEASNDRVNFYQLATDSTSSGTSTLSLREFTYTGADAASSTINFGVDIAYKYMRISAKETGVASNAGTVSVEALLSGQ